jgi:hypothetical protein
MQFSWPDSRQAFVTAAEWFVASAADIGDRWEGPDGCTGDELVTTIAGGMRLVDYLPTRTFELVIHTCDLATTLGAPLAVPTTAARQAMQIISELVVDDPRAGTVLLALTGRNPLPGDFSVL